MLAPSEGVLTFQLYRDDLFDARLLQTHLSGRSPLDLPSTRAPHHPHLSAVEALVNRPHPPAQESPSPYISPPTPTRRGPAWKTP